MKEDLLPFLLVPVGFIALGLLFAYLGAKGRRDAKAFKARATRTTALVTEVRARWEHRRGMDDSRSLLHYPVVRFALPDGREVETETPGATPAPARQDQQVEILYDPEDPTHAVIATAWGDGTIATGCVFAFGMVFALLGVLFLAGGLLVVLALD